MSLSHTLSQVFSGIGKVTLEVHWGNTDVVQFGSHFLEARGLLF